VLANFNITQLQCWHGKFYPLGKTGWVKPTYAEILI